MEGQPMKNVMIILLLLVLAVGGFVYFNQQKAAQAPAPSTTVETKDRPKAPAPKPKKEAPPKPAKPMKGSLVLPDSGSFYVNGESASGEIEVPVGKVTVSGYDGSSYSHEVLNVSKDQKAQAAAINKSDRPGNSWTTFQGDKLRRGFVKAAKRQKLETLWTSDAGSKVKSSPIIIGDQAILSPTGALLMCINLKDGSVAWQKGTTGSSLTPIATSKLAFAAADSGHFRAHTLKRGSMKGEKYLESYATSLGLIDDSAFLVTTKDNKIYSIKTKKNFVGSVPLKVNWENVINEFWKGTSAPVILADRAVYHSDAEGLVAIDLNTGAKLWPKNSGATGEETLQQHGIVADDGKMVLNFANEDYFMAPTPASDGKTLFAVTQNGIGAISASTGKTLWKANLGKNFSSSVSMAYGLLYAGTTDGYLMGLSSIDGSVAFKTKVSDKAIFSSPVIFGDQVLIATAEGKVLLRNCFSGEAIAEDATLAGARISSTPAVSDAGILVINEKGKMALYR